MHGWRGCVLDPPGRSPHAGGCPARSQGLRPRACLRTFTGPGGGVAGLLQLLLQASTRSHGQHWLGCLQRITSSHQRPQIAPRSLRSLSDLGLGPDRQLTSTWASVGPAPGQALVDGCIRATFTPSASHDQPSANREPTSSRQSLVASTEQAPSLVGLLSPTWIENHSHFQLLRIVKIFRILSHLACSTEPESYAEGEPKAQHPQPNQMSFFCYEESVLAACDDSGNLSSTDAARLLGDHGFTLQDLEEDNHEVSWCHLADRNGEALLAWLGY